jgi:tetratricopeptide (TPR) repeat protein
MSSLRSTLPVACVLFGILAVPVFAQAEVVLSEGQVIKGRVAEDDGKKIVVQLTLDGGGSGTASYTYEQLSPKTIYRLRLAKTARDNAKEQLALATYAFENGQWDDARLSYLLAEAADKKQGGALKADLAALLERAAPVAMEKAKADAKAGRVLAAEQGLSRILAHMPDSPESEKARAMLEEIKKGAMEEREKKRAAEVAAEAREKAKEVSAPIRAKYDAAHAKAREALNNSRKQSAAIQLFRDAITDFESVRKDLARIHKEQGPDSDFARHYESWERTLKNDIVETRLNIASIYFVRGSHVNALDEVNSALAVVPESSEAMAMRGRIEVASSEGGKWRW